MPAGVGGWDAVEEERLEGIHRTWEQGTSMVDTVSAAELGMRLGDWILRGGGSDEGFQFAYLFPWPCSAGVFPLKACWC